LEAEELEQSGWLAEEDPAPVEQWLDANMPVLESAGKTQGEMLQRIQDESFERKFDLEKQNLLEEVIHPLYQEVSVNVVVRGELKPLLEWLSQLQGGNEFFVVKSLDLVLDTKPNEEEEHARCNLTLARWFQP
ncbi:MAG: GspMb/PilO family protein, partial [Verrucomicrobiota bacterium]